MKSSLTFEQIQNRTQASLMNIKHKFENNMGKWARYSTEIKQFEHVKKVLLKSYTDRFITVAMPYRDRQTGETVYLHTCVLWTALMCGDDYLEIIQ